MDRCKWTRRHHQIDRGGLQGFGNKKPGSPGEVGAAWGFEDLIEFAFVDLGLSLKEFWKCSIFEWDLLCRRYKRDEDRRLEDYELNWVPWREWMALYANSVRDSKKKPDPYLPTDFKRLRFDKELEEKERITMDDNLLERLKNKYTNG